MVLRSALALVLVLGACTGAQNPGTNAEEHSAKGSRGQRMSRSFVMDDRYCVPERWTVELPPERQAPVSDPVGDCGNYVNDKAIKANPISCGPCGFGFDPEVTRSARATTRDACCYRVSSPPPPQRPTPDPDPDPTAPPTTAAPLTIEATHGFVEVEASADAAAGHLRHSSPPGGGCMVDTRWWRPMPPDPGEPMVVATRRPVTIDGTDTHVITTSMFEGNEQEVDAVFLSGDGYQIRIVFEDCGSAEEDGFLAGVRITG